MTSPATPSHFFSSARFLALCALASLAVCGPALLARNVAPSATFFNQLVALAGWGGLMAAVAGMASSLPARMPRRLWPALLVLALMAVAALASSALALLPLTLSLSTVGLLTAAALALVVAGSIETQDRQAIFHAVCLAMLLAGTVSFVLAWIQIFQPGLADGDWIAHSSTAGRAGGNLRQPNHLSSLFLWSIAALVWLHETLAERRPESSLTGERVASSLLMASLLFGLVLTVSRTGTVCVVLLALWGVLDRRLSRFSRVLLWLTPLVYALCWLGMNEWAQASAHDFAGGTQLHKSDPSSSRFGIWANTLSLISQAPWFGVGWGEFNFAWTLTPFPGRPTAFFDHTHNLPLQFLVEFGIPLGTLLLALLVWVLWKAFAACRSASPEDSPMVRAAFVMVSMMVVHSMLEYPLWYAYFLLPTAFALGVCLGQSTPLGEGAEVKPCNPWLRRSLIGASLLLAFGTAVSAFDYMRVTRIFTADDEDRMPLAQRIADGQKSVFFAHHADYAAATVATRPSTAWPAFRRAPYLLLDTRLMMAWSRGYHERGDIERARYIADRLREFKNPDSAEFFAECDKPVPSGQSEPFQCKPATRQFTYEDFKLR